ncbi:MAG TPA: biopolymer transporter ExbD [Xanthomonadales bacterium]|nr:biopolymer transporter ExbD [Xanthomonadales bacterium]
MLNQRYTRKESGINFTAVMDIAFVVMMLFFGAAFLVAESANLDDNTLADSSQSLSAAKPIIVQIDATGLLSIDGRLVERAIFEEKLLSIREQRPGSKIVIEAHPEADKETSVLVLDAARAAGIEFIEVVIFQESL